MGKIEQLERFLSSPTTTFNRAVVRDMFLASVKEIKDAPDEATQIAGFRRLEGLLPKAAALSPDHRERIEIEFIRLARYLDATSGWGSDAFRRKMREREHEERMKTEDRLRETKLWRTRPPWSPNSKVQHTWIETEIDALDIASLWNLANSALKSGRPTLTPDIEDLMTRTASMLREIADESDDEDGPKA